MARFNHFLTLLSVLLFCVTYIHAAIVNSVAGPVAQGATVYITYSFPSPPPGKVSLQIINFTTKDTKFLSEDLPITPASFKWVVDVPVGTYYLAINDGSGQNFSSNFDVSAGTLPPSTGSAPAATTPAPPAATTPAAPAASATTPAAAPSSPAASSPAKSPAAASATPSASPSTNSAPSFSGYSLLVSLAVVAAVMFHLA